VCGKEGGETRPVINFSVDLQGERGVCRAREQQLGGCSQKQISVATGGVVPGKNGRREKGGSGKFSLTGIATDLIRQQLKQTVSQRPT